MNKEILIIEDNETHFKKLKSYLKEVGYSVIPSDFAELSEVKSDPSKSYEDYALSQVSKHRNEIVLVLCDIELGNDQEGGVAVVKKIRQNDEDGLEFLSVMIPIIGLTHLSEEQKGMLLAGADEIKKKPNFKNTTAKSFSRSMLRTLIDEHVGKYMQRKNSRIPYDLRSGVKKFDRRYKRNTRAFIMTSYNEQHLSISKRIKDVLNEYDIDGCMANDVEGGLVSTLSLWENIKVYIHGCDFGIGIYASETDIENTLIFDKNTGKPIEKKLLFRINANMSQEVGYMLALQKDVCILKGENLEKIPTDLSEKVYVAYNDKNLEDKLRGWLEGRGYKRV